MGGVFFYGPEIHSKQIKYAIAGSAATVLIELGTHVLDTVNMNAKILTGEKKMKIAEMIRKNGFSPLFKGIAAVPRGSLVVVAAILPMFGLPEAGLLLVMGIDQFLDMGRTATNVLGNSIATAVVAKWEGELGTEEEFDPLCVDLAAGQGEAVAPAMPSPARMA